jgi:hypothetical protein
MSWELLLGRSLALCAHPAAAWRILSRRGRAFVLGAYFTASYLTVLMTLLVL